MAACNVDFDNAVNYALNLLKASDLVLKREQKEALHAVCVEKRDCLCVLPTGFGKSLIFQLDPSTLDYLYSRLPHQSQQQLCFGCLPFKRNNIGSN